ncbi:MAG TPA: GNAT family N-acetyltransferase [Kofleriaceae bacterium]|nr:GNAT family N-acetyltransferase [Kofleriaceae bacterium]
MTIEVRPAQRADDHAVAAVSESALRTLRRVYRPTPAALARKRDLAILPRLVAVVEDAVVGTVEYVAGEDRLHLMGLFVAETYRRQGVARALVDELAILARGRPLSLNTIRETGNVPIFERLGFVVAAESLAVDFVGEEPLHDVLMSRASQ